MLYAAYVDQCRLEGVSLPTEAARSILTVPVRHDGPLNTHELPSRIATVMAFVLDTNFQQVLYKDLSRKRAVLVADAIIIVSHSGAAGSGGFWPANSQLTLTHCDALWIAAKTGSGVNLTVIPENWAD